MLKESDGLGGLFDKLGGLIGDASGLYGQIRGFGKKPETVTTTPVATAAPVVNVDTSWMKQYAQDANKPLIGLAVVALIGAGFMWLMSFTRGK